MNIKIIATLAVGLATANIAIASPQTQETKHVMVVNNSELSLKPTAEGFSSGCIGGSLPPVLKPIAPHTTRELNVLFVRYSDQCQFNVLPKPSMTTYLQACHEVKANDTVTFTGKNLSDLRCTGH